MDDKAEVKKPQDARVAESRADTRAEATVEDQTVTEQPTPQLPMFMQPRSSLRGGGDAGAICVGICAGLCCFECLDCCGCF